MNAPIAPPIPPMIPYITGTTIIAPNPIPNPNALAAGPACDPAKLPSDPAIMEIKAKHAPINSPRIAYVTAPTLNAEPGPMRLSVAIVPPCGELAAHASRTAAAPKAYFARMIQSFFKKNWLLSGNSIPPRVPPRLLVEALLVAQTSG